MASSTVFENLSVTNSIALYAWVSGGLVMKAIHDAFSIALCFGVASILPYGL